MLCFDKRVERSQNHLYIVHCARKSVKHYCFLLVNANTQNSIEIRQKKKKKKYLIQFQIIVRASSQYLRRKFYG